MKLVIFGATGKTGAHLVPLALAAGHEVTVLVRTPSKLTIDDQRLTVLTGDVKNADQVAGAIAGAEAVVSVLGPTRNRPDFNVTHGITHILAAMKKYGVRRLVMSAGAGVADPNDQPGAFERVMGVLVRIFSRYVYEDMVEAVNLVRQSNVDWTVVRVPMLTNDPARGSIKVTYVGKGLGSRITRADLAGFMLEQVDDMAYLQKAPAISN
jgi:putative NADH-flavin reductase